MKPELAKQLQFILDKRNEKKQAAMAKETEQQNIEAKNLTDFAAKKEVVIKPALKEIMQFYGEKGFPVRIEEDEERQNSKGGFDPPYILLNFSGGNPYEPMRPEFRLRFEKRNRIVHLYTSTGSQAGGAGEVRLDDISADWIHEAFVKYAAK